MILESAAVAAILETLEVAALPSLGAFLASEVIGKSRSRHNGVFQLGWGIIRAICREIAATDPQSSPDTPPVPSTASKSETGTPTPPAKKTPQRSSTARKRAPRKSPATKV